jgi:enoyl-CoA hydratase/carnithine racemase
VSGTVHADRPAPRILRLSFTNSGKHNALDHPILDGIADALASTDARSVILTSSGRVFCAGYDIGDFRDDEMFMREAEKLVAHPHTEAIDALDRFDGATVCALGGDAIGGGLELALACDLRVSGADATLGMPPARLGLIYSHTGLRRFVDAIGLPRTRELFLRGATSMRARRPTVHRPPPLPQVGIVTRPPDATVMATQRTLLRGSRSTQTFLLLQIG